MANFERGAYEPSDEVRVFDGSEDDEDVEGSRLPLLIVLALLVLAMFAGVVWLAYTQGVARGRGETPILTAPPGPERVAPQNPGGATVPYQGFKIYEQPAPPDDAAEDLSVPPEPVAKPEAPKAETPAKPAPAPKPASKPAPKPAAALAPPPMKQSLPATPAAPATAAPRSLGALVQSTSAAPSASGGYTLQIGAYKSDAEARAAWNIYQSRHAALVSGYRPDVQRADLGDKGVWYRLRIAGFADHEVALALCDRLKADGGGCFLGK
jgi:cell division septation protein DedD